MDLSRVRAVSDGNDPETGEVIHVCSAPSSLEFSTACEGTVRLRARLTSWIRERRETMGLP